MSNDIEIEKFKKLYRSVNKMMARLGADGEITATDDEVSEVMNDLYDIDGGEFDNEI